jgi:hypothetical protein
MQNSASLAERRLWCAVIEQAFIDTGIISDPRGVRAKAAAVRTASKERDEAARWLLHNREDFVYVCTLAGVSPSVIRHAARTANAGR